jgi:hypothetical protein
MIGISYLCSGADPDERDSFARTPFHLALQYGHLHVIDHLLATFPPGLPDSHSVFSPPSQASLLSLAVESSSPDVVKIVLRLFAVSEIDVTNELKRLKNPAFANGFPIARSYGGGRGRTEVNNPTGWKEILKLLHDFVEPVVSHHLAPPPEAERHSRHYPVQGGSNWFAPTSPNPGDFSNERTSEASGSHPRSKRDKARRKRGTGNQYK